MGFILCLSCAGVDGPSAGGGRRRRPGRVRSAAHGGREGASVPDWAAAPGRGGPVGNRSPVRTIPPSRGRRFTAAENDPPPAGTFLHPSLRRRERPGPNRRGASWLQSLPDAELLDQGLVAVLIDRLEIVEQATALPDELQEPAPAVVILLVRLEVLGEVRDAFAQQRHLHLGRARVLLVSPVLRDELGLLLLNHRHSLLLLFGFRHRRGGEGVRRERPWNGPMLDKGFQLVSQRIGGIQRPRTGRTTHARLSHTASSRPSGSIARQSPSGAPGMSSFIPCPRSLACAGPRWMVGHPRSASTIGSSRARSVDRSERASRSTSSRSMASASVNGPAAVRRSSARCAGAPSTEPRSAASVRTYVPLPQRTEMHARTRPSSGEDRGTSSFNSSS